MKSENYILYIDSTYSFLSPVKPCMVLAMHFFLYTHSEQIYKPGLNLSVDI